MQGHHINNIPIISDIYHLLPLISNNFIPTTAKSVIFLSFSPFSYDKTIGYSPYSQIFCTNNRIHVKISTFHKSIHDKKRETFASEWIWIIFHCISINYTKRNTHIKSAVALKLYIDVNVSRWMKTNDVLTFVKIKVTVKCLSFYRKCLDTLE